MSKRQKPSEAQNGSRFFRLQFELGLREPAGYPHSRPQQSSPEHQLEMVCWEADLVEQGPELQLEQGVGEQVPELG